MATKWKKGDYIGNLYKEMTELVSAHNSLAYEEHNGYQKYLVVGMKFNSGSHHEYTELLSEDDKKQIFTLVKTRVEERISVLEDELMEMLQEARKQFN